MSLRCLLPPLLALLPTALHAQANRAAESLEVVLSPFGEWAGPPPFVQAGRRDFEPVELHPAAYSGPFELPMPFILYQENPAASEQGADPEAPPYLPISAPVQPPEGMTKPLFLIRWNPDSKQAESFVIDNDPSALPWGAYQLVNFSRVAVGLQFTGREPQPVAPGQVRIIDPGVAEPTRSGIRLLAEVTDGQGRKSLVPSALSTQTILQPDKRTILLVADDPNHPSGVAYQTLIDFRQPSEEEIEAAQATAPPEEDDGTHAERPAGDGGPPAE